LTEVKLRRYQRKGVRLSDTKFDGRVLLADDMGLGKTVQFLALIKRRKSFPAIVVCPSSVKWHWQDTARRLFQIKSIVLEGRKPYWFDVKRYQLVIINYDVLPWWAKRLKSNVRAKAVGIDEGQYVTNREAKRSWAVRQLCKGSRKRDVVVMSGSPMVNRPYELWHLLHILRPDKWPWGTFHLFAKKYCHVRTGFGGRIKYTGGRRLDQLNRILKREVMIRRLKKDVLKELPPIQTELVVLDIKNRAKYEAAQRRVTRWLNGEVRWKPTKKRVTKITDTAQNEFTMLKKLAATYKMPSMLEWIDDWLADSNRKLIVFTWHHSIIEKFHQYYGERCVTIDGRTHPRDRKAAVQRFTKVNNCRLAFCQIKAVGIGTDGLQYASSDVALAEFPWNPADVSQAIARAHRIGQLRGVNAYYLVGRDTVEHVLCRLLQNKQVWLDATLDGKKVTEFDLVDKLARALIRKA
jgi:SWI/SNF-related matrix-associated actin-dependent regulator 1 of chromatin subfamily A